VKFTSRILDNLMEFRGLVERRKEGPLGRVKGCSYTRGKSGARSGAWGAKSLRARDINKPLSVPRRSSITRPTKLRIADFLLYIAFPKRRPLGRASLTSSAGDRLALCLTTLQMAGFYSATLAGNLSAVDKLNDTPANAQPAPDPSPSSAPPPLIIERPMAGIEIELTGGRRLRFDRGADPDQAQGPCPRRVPIHLRDGSLQSDADTETARNRRLTRTRSGHIGKSTRSKDRRLKQGYGSTEKPNSTTC
jgi:hypothetical protein